MECIYGGEFWDGVGDVRVTEIVLVGSILQAVTIAGGLFLFCLELQNSTKIKIKITETFLK